MTLLFADNTAPPNTSQLCSNQTDSCNATFLGSDDNDAKPFYNDTELVFIFLGGCLLSLLTIGGNVLVVVSYATNRRLKKVTNLFILSLSISDIAVGVFSINLYTSYVALKRWPLGVVVCDIWLCLDYACCQASVINLILICIDRYFSITKPLRYRVKRTKKRALIAITLAWFVAFFQWAPWIVSYPFIRGERTVPSDACYVQFLYENSFASIITSIAAYYVPVLIMGSVYLRIYFLVKKRERDFNRLTAPPIACKKRCFTFPVMNESSTNNVRGRNYTMVERKSARKFNFAKLTFVLKQKKAARLLSIIFLTFTVTWLPYYILTLLSPFYPTSIPTPLWDFSYMLCYLNSTVNPFCYALCNKEFRLTFKKLLCPKSRRTEACDKVQLPRGNSVIPNRRDTVNSEVSYNNIDHFEIRGTRTNTDIHILNQDSTF